MASSTAAAWFATQPPRRKAGKPYLNDIKDITQIPLVGGLLASLMGRLLRNLRPTLIGPFIGTLLLRS
jgi:hypothetical protein